MFCGRTDLRLSLSKAKNSQESDGDLQNHAVTPKQAENIEKPKCSRREIPKKKIRESKNEMMGIVQNVGSRILAAVRANFRG